MLQTLKNSQISDDEKKIEGYFHWSHAVIERGRPILLTMFKYTEDGVEQICTQLHSSIDTLKPLLNSEKYPVQKLQILTPDGMGWVLLDVVMIRRCNFYEIETDDDGVLNKLLFEEFITSCGECFTFKTLAEGKQAKSPHEIIYQASTKHSSV